MPRRTATSLCHWGAFDATIVDGRLTETTPWRSAGADKAMIGAWPSLVYSPQRIDRPHVRRSFLECCELAGGAGRGHDEMVPVEWDFALDLVARQLRRVHAEHGPASVFGGSYGWSSAGRFHHARTQVRRFLACAGGYTDQVGNYSWGAANAILPHVLGSAEAVSSAATSWDSIAESSDVVVAFGGLNPKNWRVTSGGAGCHRMPRQIEAARERGVRFVIVSPNAGDIPEGLDAVLIAPRPNTDTAIMLGLAHQLLADARVDHDFIATHVEGHERFFGYLRGESDGIAKSLEWAAGISGVAVDELRRLSRTISPGRVMLTASWSLQRADHGEQPYWALIALAAMLGQIGLPGGGFSFGYGSMNAIGGGASRGYVPSLPVPPNPAQRVSQGAGGSDEGAIPAAAFVDAFMNPGKVIDFNGARIRYPDVRMVYWAGGNPFHHAQDLFLLERAWQRSEAIVVHEPWWTSTARRADIVLPTTTSVERTDIGGSSRDPFVFAMPRLIEPIGQARSDFDIFCALADRLGCRADFDEGLDEDGWLRRLWAGSIAHGEKAGVAVPDYATLVQQGHWRTPPLESPEILLEQFRADASAHPLATPSGRIELYSSKIEGFGYDDCPAHPAWLEPIEWLGNAAPDELHLLTNQPATRLHSQLYQAGSDANGGPEQVEMHSQDARSRGIGDGDRVRLWNARGACVGVARLTERLRAGVVVMPTGAWFEPVDGLERNGNPNVLTADRRTSRLGQACAAQSTLVRIERWT